MSDNEEIGNEKEVEEVGGSGGAAAMTDAEKAKKEKKKEKQRKKKEAKKEKDKAEKEAAAAKKDGQKKDGAGTKKKTPGDLIKEQLRKRQEEEDRIRKEEEEKERRLEELENQRLEKLRIEKEKKEREKQKKKDKVAQLKKEGKYMTPDQKQKLERQRQVVEQMKQEGIIVVGTEAKEATATKKPKYGEKKKPAKAKQTDQDGSGAVSHEQSPEDAVGNADASGEQKENVAESWDQLAIDHGTSSKKGIDGAEAEEETSSEEVSCLSCDVKFGSNLNAFIDHTTDTHSDDAIQCTHCGEVSSSGAEYAMHFIYAHTGENDTVLGANSFANNLSSHSSSSAADDEHFPCPNCAFTTTDPAALASHFDKSHTDNSMDEGAASSSTKVAASCPVGDAKIAVANLNDHANSHFDQDMPTLSVSHSDDYQLALEIDRQGREARKGEETKEFEHLKLEYGMDESGSYSKQGLQALDRADGKGQMTSGQLYDAKQRLSMNEAGIEDANYPTKNLIDKIRELSRRCADVLDVHTCTTIDHYSSSQSDFGFGCGYRNIQMMLSSVKNCEIYRKALWGNGPIHIPSIPNLQALIESAWKKGFDSVGCAQLNGRLQNTRKWIGATEAAVLFQLYRIRLQLIDVHTATGPKSTHPLMARWCYDYFKDGTTRGAFIPPLYFQHEGHSQTVIGVERTRSGQLRLLIFDPSHRRARMQQMTNSVTMADLKLIRKSVNELTKPKYQLVVLRGLMESDEEYEVAKTYFDYVRIPASGEQKENVAESWDQQIQHETPEEKRERILNRIKKRRQDGITRRTDEVLRSPVICVLGHVDTGKTKILDKIRRTHVQDGEAGGITQQIGATMVPADAIKEQAKMVKDFEAELLRLPGFLIIDTPGHESFSNLRSRGSSLCDIAILVVDIMHALEPQTIESLNLLKKRKTPFIVALNKVDRLYEWKPAPNKDIRNVLKSQKPNCQAEFNERVNEVKLKFAEQGVNATLFWENNDPDEYVSLVPTSAISGDGMGNLIASLAQHTQTHLKDRVTFCEELRCTVLEVKALPGLGTTVDVILVDGTLHVGDTIVVPGTEGPIVTQIRELLMPQPLREMRVKNPYEHFKEVRGAQGIKILAKDFDKALAGLPLLVAQNDDEVDILKEEVAGLLQSALQSIRLSDRGVYVQASTLGSLEALLSFLKDQKIPYCGINIGPVHKRDVVKASTMLEHESLWAVILAFDVKIEREAQTLADELGVRIFSADIIYHLQDAYIKYRDEWKEKKRQENAHLAVYPVKMRVLPQHVYNSRDPMVMGVIIEDGIAKIGTQICVPTKECIIVGTLSSIEANHKAVDTARKGQEVCIKIENTTGDAPKMYGRHFDYQDMLVSKITRESIDVMKTYFRDDLQKSDWQLIVELKKSQGIM